MSMYIVDGDLLTALADALREKGELTNTTPFPIVRKTSNAVDLNTAATTDLDWENPDDKHFTDRIFINGAFSIRVKVYAKIYYNPQGGNFLKIGDYTYEPASSTSNYFTPTLVIPGNVVDIEWNTFMGGNYFYYMELTGLDENGIPIGTTYEDPLWGEDGKYTLTEMEAAIKKLRPYTQDTLEVTTNGVYEVYDYRWCAVQIDNETIPTTYKEAIVTSRDNYTFDLSNYILTDNAIFTLGFTIHMASSGDGSKKYLYYAMYHHNPTMKDGVREVYSFTTNPNSSNTSLDGITEFPSNKLGSSIKATFENGILSFTNSAGEARLVGTSAVLRYLD